jgi:putative MFS transporter
LDHLPISSVHRFVILALAFAYFFELSDQGTLGATAPALIKIWHLSVNTFAFVTSAAFAGGFVGATLGGWFVDRIGRKRGIFYATAWYSLFSLLNAAAWNPLSLGLLRFLTSIGLAAMTVAVNTYISEFFPARSRGKYLAWTITFGVLGGPATSWFAFFIIPLAAWAWRLVFVWGALGVVALFFISKLEESPRWYAAHGQREKAEATMERIEAAVRAEKGALPPIPAAGPQEVKAPVPYRELFQGKYLNRTVLLVIYGVFLPLGYYGFQSWVPALLAAHGLSLVKSLAFSSMISLGLPLGAFITSSLPSASIVSGELQ